MRATHLALSRALSFCSGATSFELDQFFHRATWELHHSASSDFAAVAMVIKRADGSCFIGRSREHQALPAETLLGLLVEKGGERVSCRVKDHALDTVRFIDNRFRTSIIVRIQIPSSILPGAEAALWFGLQGGAASQSIAEAESIGRESSEWLEWYGSVLEASIRAAKERDGARQTVSDIRSVVHDVRAPLGVIKYLLRGGGSERDEQSTVVARELEYLERLISQCAPNDAGKQQATCDVGDVISRVYRRYEKECQAGQLVWERGYESVYAQIADLDLERIVTNLVSNAIRHAPHGQVAVGVEREGERVVVSVRDNGEGIPKNLLAQLLDGKSLDAQGSSGWGIGLQGCRAKVSTWGGELRISSEVGKGTVISALLHAAVETPVVVAPMHVADSRKNTESVDGSGDVYLVDDDVEHSESLARFVRNDGLRAVLCGSIQDLLSRYEITPQSIILCDGHMPDGGAEKLLKILSTRADPPIVAVVSGDATDDQMYRLAALGAQAFFPKPVNLEELSDWIRAQLAHDATNNRQAKRA